MVSLQSRLSNCTYPRMSQRILPAGFIAPCLPTKTEKLPSGREWLHEIKHDGFRVKRPYKGSASRLVTDRRSLATAWARPTRLAIRSQVCAMASRSARSFSAETVRAVSRHLSASRRYSSGPFVCVIGSCRLGRFAACLCSASSSQPSATSSNASLIFASVVCAASCWASKARRR